MKNCDKLSVIVSHFFGYSLRDIAKMFSTSAACISNDRRRNPEIWKSGYALLYKEQIDAIEYTVGFLKRRMDPVNLSELAKMHEHLSQTYKNLTRLVIYEDLPKRFDPPEIVTHALISHLPCDPLPLPTAKNRIMIDFPTALKPRQVQRRKPSLSKKVIVASSDVVMVAPPKQAASGDFTEHNFVDKLSEQFQSVLAGKHLVSVRSAVSDKTAGV